MVIYYHLNDSGTNIIDSSNNHYSGTANNTAFNSGGGILGLGSIYFNGFNSSINLTTAKWNGTFSFTLWSNLSLKSNPGYFIQSRDGSNKWSFSEGTDFIRFGVYNDSGTLFTAGTTQNPNNDKGLNVMWSGVFDGENITLYKNGFYYISTTINGTVTNFDVDRIGQFSTGFLNGSLNDVIVWNNTISSDQIKTIYYNYLDTVNINSCGSYSLSSVNYNLTTNLNTNGTCLTFTGSYIRFNGNGYNITFANGTTQGRGVQLASGAIHNTISNVRIITEEPTTTTKYGILDSGGNNEINNNFINVTGSNDAYGIYFSRIGSSKATNNTIFTYGSNDNWGMFLSSSNNLTLYNNTIITYGQTSEGIVSINTSYITMSENYINTSNSMGLRLEGYNLESYTNVIDTLNLVNGYPLNYSYNQNNTNLLDLDYSNYGQVVIGYSNNLTINNSLFAHSGIYLSNVKNSIINNNTLNTDLGGLRIGLNSTNNKITNNWINSSIPLPNIIDNSNNNNFTSNQIFNYGTYVYDVSFRFAGIFVYNSNRTNIISNSFETAGNNGYGVYIGAVSSFTNVTNNNITTNGTGSNNIVAIDYNEGTFSSGNNLKCLGFCGKLIYYRESINGYISGTNSYNNTQNLDNNIYLQSKTFTTNYTVYVTNALLMNTTDICSGSSSDISSNNGFLNINVSSNNDCTILDNFNVDESSPRTSSPILISASTTTSKTITSTLSQGVNATVIISVPAKCPSGATFEGNGYSYNSCDGNTVVYSLNNIPNGNSILSLSFAGGTPTLNECDAKSSLTLGIASFGKLSNIAPIVVMVTIIVYLIFGYKVYRRSGNPKLQGVENIWNGFITLIMFGSLAAVFALILLSNIPC